jgi:hypothetical protein
MEKRGNELSTRRHPVLSSTRLWQRGFPRVVGAAADIGAYEVQNGSDEIFANGFDSSAVIAPAMGWSAQPCSHLDRATRIPSSRSR